MQYTLRKRLEASDAVTGSVLDSFLSEDPLAALVVEGKTSYRDSIEPIEEKYGSLWRKMFSPKKDDEFDEEVRNTVTSINNVGADCIDAAQFTTQSMRSYFRYLDFLSVVTGSAAGGLVALSVYSLPDLPPETSVYIKTFVKSAPFIIASMPLLVWRAIPVMQMNARLSNLRKAAENTDDFLRKALSD